LFQDIYFSRDDGIAESSHVFLSQNRLESRWRTLSPGAHFVIGETGFGTGLNFLLARALFERCAPADARLTFRSLEAHPLSSTDLARALTAWPSLQAHSAALCAAWPVPVKGLHTLHFADGRITLQLYLGDINDALDAWLDDPTGGQTAAGNVADAWFLDGFAPACNESMWRAEVLQRVGRLSRPGTTFATFTAAGAVKRGLKSAGFAVEKCTGYGRKREMLRGEFAQPPVRALPRRGESPWHLSGWHKPAAQTAVVVGSGIAGSTIAAELARTGWSVTVLEQGPHIAGGASGNPQGALFTQLPAAPSAQGEFTLHAYLYAARYYRRLNQQHAGLFSPSGLLQLFTAKEHALFEKLHQRFHAYPDWVRFLTPAEASERAGRTVKDHAIWLADSGWLDPPAVCAHLLSHPRIRVHCGRTVSEIGTCAEGIEAHTKDGRTYQAAVVVIAGAVDSQRLLSRQLLELSPVRGQLSGTDASAFGPAPDCVVCGEGYITPPYRGAVWFGASYGPGDWACDVREADHAANLQRMRLLFTDPLPTSAGSLMARVSTRCATRDRLPLVGPVPAEPAFESFFGPLTRDAKRYLGDPAPYQPGVFLMTGFGSRGLSSAPLCAAALAAQINAEPVPLSRQLQQHLAPARFRIRDIKRAPNL